MKPDINRVVNRLNELYMCGLHEDGTYSRLAFTKEDMRGRKKFISYFSKIGIKTRIDAAGNIIARLSGKDERLPSIIIGSHLDTVPNGGKYDGALGCIAGLEVCQAIVESGYTLDHPLEVVVFTDEEGARFGKGLFGSSAFTSTSLSDFSGEDTDAYGNKRSDVLRDYGIDSSKADQASRDKASVHCFLELHIEQGGSLYKNKKPIGVVSSIAGVNRYEITVDGQANHAGSTVMSDRKDALVAAAHFIHEVPEVVAAYGNNYSVATVGTIRVIPNSVNVVPGSCVFSLEIRDQSSEIMKKIEYQLRIRLDEICVKHAVECLFKYTSSHDPGPMDGWVKNIMAAVCEEAGYDYCIMPSGAFHDSLLLTTVFPTGMIFIPSVNGLSHSTSEFSLDADIHKGCDVLLQTVLKIDKKVRE